MALNGIVNSASFLNQVADIAGINNWELQEAYYNGALFHWMQPAYTGVDPLGSLVNYAQSALGTSPQKPNYSTWANLSSFEDYIDRKLAIYPVPNYNGYYVEDFGSNGVQMEFVGLIFGTDYMSVLDKCALAFNDVETSIGSGVGVLSGSNFRVLNHPLFSGPIEDVYFKDFSIITSSDKFQAVSFKLTLIAANPLFFTKSLTQTESWMQEAQAVLDGGESAIAGITQTFSLGQSLINTNFSPLPAGSSTSSKQLPIVNGKGQYLTSVIAEIETNLTNLANTFTNCMAFLVQNDGGIILNPFWQGITIDYASLPIFLAPGQTFSQADVQVLLTFYNDQINSFNEYATTNGFTYNLQANIFALAESIAYLSNFASIVLAQNTPKIVATTTKTIDLYTLMFENKSSFDNFASVNQVNSGQWYSCLAIPPGITVNMS